MILLHNSNYLNNQTILAFKTYLLVWLAPDMITLANYDPGTNEIISVKSFNYAKDELANIDALIPEVHSLKMNYRKKILIYSGQKFTLVPEKFLSNTNLIENYIHINFVKEEKETIHKDYIDLFKVYNIFSIDDTTQKLISHIEFDKTYHSITAYLKSIQTSLNISEPNSVFIDIQSNYFTVTLFQYGIMQLCNSYPYKSTEEILYHIINISKHFNLDIELDTFRFSGVIYPDSSLYKLIYKYIHKLEFLSNPAQLNYHYSISSIPQHIYYNVFALATCVS
jgi:hypothetical protein